MKNLLPPISLTGQAGAGGAAGAGVPPVPPVPPQVVPPVPPVVQPQAGQVQPPVPPVPVPPVPVPPVPVPPVPVPPVVQPQAGQAQQPGPQAGIQGQPGPVAGQPQAAAQPQAVAGAPEVGKSPYVWKIRGPESAPGFFNRPIRLSLEERHLLEKEIKKLLRLGLVKYSHAPSRFNSSFFLIRKRDGTARPIFSAKSMNGVVYDYPMTFPLLGEVLDRLASHGPNSVHSSLDLKSAYFSIGIDEASQAYTQFSPWHGESLRWCCLPMGYKASAQALHLFMSRHVITGKLKQFCLFYADDLVISSSSPSLHWDHLSQVLDALIKSGFRCNFPKGAWFVRKFCTLGAFYDSGIITPLNRHITAVQNLVAPKTISQARQLCGLLNYMRKYLPYFGIIAKPLFSALRGQGSKGKKGTKGQGSDMDKVTANPKKVNWNASCDVALKDLKEKLSIYTVLKFKNFPPGNLFFVSTVEKFQILEYRKVAILPQDPVTMLI